MWQQVCVLAKNEHGGRIPTAHPCHCSFRTFANGRHPNKVTNRREHENAKLSSVEAAIELQDAKRFAGSHCVQLLAACSLSVWQC